MPETPPQPLAETLAVTVAKTEKRLRIVQAVTAILLLAVAGYLAYAYVQIARVDAQMVTYNVQRYVEKRLPNYGDMLAEQLERDAPSHVDHLASAALAAPEALADRAHLLLLDLADPHLKRLEEQLYEDLAEMTREAAARLDHAPGATEKGKIRRALKQAATTFGSETIRLINTYYDERYRPHADDYMAYLDKLARNEGLTEEEARQRELIEIVMTLHEKWREDPRASGGPGPANP